MCSRPGLVYSIMTWKDNVDIGKAYILEQCACVSIDSALLQGLQGSIGVNGRIFKEGDAGADFQCCIFHKQAFVCAVYIIGIKSVFE